MVETKPQKPEHKGYFVGEVVKETDIVVARPDGTAMTDKEALAEVLNKLDAIYLLVKQNL